MPALEGFHEALLGLNILLKRELGVKQDAIPPVDVDSEGRIVKWVLHVEDC